MSDLSAVVRHESPPVRPVVPLEKPLQPQQKLANQHKARDHVYESHRRIGKVVLLLATIHGLGMEYPVKESTTTDRNMTQCEMRTGSSHPYTR